MLFGAMKMKTLLALVVVLVLISLPAESSANFANKEYDAGLSIGYWFPGTIDIEGTDVDQDGGILFRAIGDMYVAPKFAVGAYFNYWSGTMSYGSLEVDAWFYEIGVAMKPRIILSPTMALKPGLNIGYRKSDRESLSAGETTEADGLGVNLSVELQILLQNGYIFYVDGGFFSQPAGGNEDADVTWAPIMYLSVGIGF